MREPENSDYKWQLLAAF